MRGGVRGLDRRLRATAGGKSGLHGSGWLSTATDREVRESATENKPPGGAARLRTVRVKRCGKSAPRAW